VRAQPDPGTALYGLLAEFAEPEAVLDAARKARDEGYRRMEAYSPYPVEGLAEAVGHPPDRVAAVVLTGGILGGLTGFFLQYYANVFSYPLNIGGRPHNSWPSFIPITFELTVLGAALFAVFGMLAMNGLPRPHHPLFGVAEFDLASRDKFFLCIESADPRFDRERTRRFLEGLGSGTIREVAS
jgi:hypothetical protein